MSPVVQSALVTGLLGVAIVWISTRANRRSEAATNALEGKKVDLSVLTASLEELKERVERSESRVGVMEDDLETERQARLVAMTRAEAAEARAMAAERRASAAQARANRLEARVTQLENTLRANAITIPPVP